MSFCCRGRRAQWLVWASQSRTSIAARHSHRPISESWVASFMRHRTRGSNHIPFDWNVYCDFGHILSFVISWWNWILNLLIRRSTLSLSVVQVEVCIWPIGRLRYLPRQKQFCISFEFNVRYGLDYHFRLGCNSDYDHMDFQGSQISRSYNY